MNDNRYDELNGAAKHMVDRLINAIAASDEVCEFPRNTVRWTSTEEDGSRIYTFLDLATVGIHHKYEVTRFPKRAQFRYYKIEEAKKVTA
jgi:hypothetical protein|tara:strand:- start:34 stop:303 length:270 start_codon:yes stop_codon:yes gene_type:complete